MSKMKTVSGVVIVLVMSLAVGCASTGGGKGGGSASWDFDDPAADTAGWELATTEFYQYHGDIKLSRDDTTFPGNGVLRLDVDFTKDAALEWSEPKIKIDLPRAFNVKGVTQWTFDFYYNPALRSSGSFKTKVFTGGVNIDSAGDIPEDGEDAGNGFVKTTASILIMPTAGFLTDMRFSVAGYLTDYNGPVFFDNMRWE
jgi:hypothetical protein